MYPAALPYPSPNYRSPRRAAITHVVMHTCESSDLNQCLNWLTDATAVDSQGDPARVSAHYVVDSSGVYQLVQEGDEAWGARGANRYGIQVEVVGFANDPSTWSPEVTNNLAALLDDVTARNAIPLVYRDLATMPENNRGIVAHAASDPARRSDPGIYFPWTEIKRKIQQRRGDSVGDSAGLAVVVGLIGLALLLAWGLRS